ncbi:MAG: LacI family DNA-binding transcriptional regulator [Oscillospiraceae bacterium]
MAITIKDIAKETGLAISTISKYMNGGTVRSQNKQVIDDAINKLGYHPAQAARGLRSARTYNVGIVLDGLENQYIALMSAEFEKRLHAAGYSFVVCCHRDDIELMEKSMEFLISKQVDGILVAPISTQVDYLAPVRKAGIPVIALDRIPKHLECDSVTTNAAKGSYEAVEYLINQGHNKIAIITGAKIGNAGYDTAVERYNGYLRAMEDYCLPVLPGFVREGDFSFESGFECMNDLWELQNKPTALFVTNYNMTLGTVTAIHNLKIQVPGQLSLAVFDDLEFSLISNPKLTAVRQPAEKIAETSLEILFKRMRGENEDYPKRVKLPATFHIRDSVAKLK